MKFRLLVKDAATGVGVGVGVELGPDWLLLYLAGWRRLLGRLDGRWD